MKWKSFKSVRGKISFLVAILCIMVTVIFLVSSSYFAKVFLENYIDKTVSKDSMVYSQNIGYWIEERINEMRTYANNSLIESMDWNKMFEYLSEEIRKKPSEYYGFMVADKEGNYTTTVNNERGNIADKDYFKLSMEGKSIVNSPVISKATGKKALILTTPIIVDGEIKGVFGVGIDLMNLYDVFNRNQKNEGGKVSYIVDKNGVIVVHPDRDLIYKENILKESEFISKGLVDQSDYILKNTEGKIEYNKENDKFTVYFHSIPNTDGWRNITLVSENIFLKPIIDFVAYQIFIAIILIFIAIIASKVLARKIANPIVNLAKTFNKVANGEFTATADESSADEIGEAAKSFNKMMVTVGRKSYIDPLTNLFSRESIIDRMRLQINFNKESGDSFALLFIGIDKFKKVNDMYGHKVGDVFLKKFSEKLKNALDKEAIIGRMTGDEFLIILPKINSHSQVANTANKILNMVRQPWSIDGIEIYITASIGAAIFPQDSENEGNLTKFAGVAKSKAKECGGNDFQFYSSEMNEKLQEQLTLDSMLHIAIEKNEFIVHYQPFISVESGKIEAVEALIRWNSSQLGMVSPNKFIPRAEENGLIIPIGNWVLKEACKQNKYWQDKGFRPICVCVNVSPYQFEKEDFVENVKVVLEQTKLDPKYLELEITENVAMGNVEDKINKLLELKDLGIKISIDDFGTGYSSLSYLKRFPIDNLKIDQSFVRDIGNESSKSIISTIVSIANNLRLGLVAEGVETVEQFEFIREQKCGKIQGYLFSKPLEPVSFEGILKEDKHFC